MFEGHHYIDGKWSPSVPGERIDVFNPCTEEVIGSVPAEGAADVARVIAAAKVALSGWRRAGGAVRAKFLAAVAARLRGRAEELAVLYSRNNGKPLAETRIDIVDAVTSFSYYASMAEALDARQDMAIAVPDPAYRSQLRLEPSGVAALIEPWNFPLATTSWKLAPALATGCTVVFRLSEIMVCLALQRETCACRDRLFVGGARRHK
jgi:betaine-aldehyde dehydrogenase